MPVLIFLPSLFVSLLVKETWLEAGGKHNIFHSDQMCFGGQRARKESRGTQNIVVWNSGTRIEWGSIAHGSAFSARVFVA